MAQNSQVSERNGISVTSQASELPAGPVTKFGTIVGDGEGGGALCSVFSGLLFFLGSGRDGEELEAHGD